MTGGGGLSFDKLGVNSGSVIMIFRYQKPRGMRGFWFVILYSLDSRFPSFA
jgi:hypothetical protein